MTRCRASLSLLALVALALAGCTGGDAGPAEPTSVGTPDDAGVLHVTGTDNLQWDPDGLEAPPGEVTIALTCQDRVNHNIVVEVDGERTLVAECAPGGTAEGSLDLAAGEYRFVCTIPGHESSMRGSLTVG